MAPLHATDDDLASLIGSSIRSARLAARWTQADLARRLGTTQSAVSRLETGAGSCLDIRLASAAFRILGIRLSVDASTLGLVGRRQQSDFVHARCAGYVARRLQDAGWDNRLEVEIGSGRYRGWIDLLAYRAVDRSAFCIELKTEIDDLGRIERTLAWYEREAWGAARRFGWRPTSMTTGLLVLMSTENDARIQSNRESLHEAFPARAGDLARWLATPGEAKPRSAIAMIDPRSRRMDWLRPTISDGRRSPAPYRDYRDSAERLAKNRHSG
jgi:transcriptional regulator with XRE-family HTH domain